MRTRELTLLKLLVVDDAYIADNNDICFVIKYSSTQLVISYIYSFNVFNKFNNNV